MDPPTLINANTTYPLDSTDPLFYLCWRRQSCKWCLQGDVPCSWCAISSTCVPNRSHLPILAPLGSSQICPLGSKERWELRAAPFGCNVSTTTFLATVVGVLGTLVAVALGCFVVWVWPRAKVWWKRDGKISGRYYVDWVSGGFWRRGGGDEEDLERRPLLGG
ncbi:hypothetical protein FE257_007062 [Aspergillus nanangensis]|uniref:PSI domain-containing protein n=1 Tax=Aspergillus nanangensis TaxID=2582783 RepID=A0AAD4CNI6_ASPNN|nr:hypothetical protein FE257_007062 [Aspergillus nanangensis]